MKFLNHYKMGNLIYKNMTEIGIPIEKSLFIFGNLAPDILITYAFNPHSHSKCSSRLIKLLKRLYAIPKSSRLKYSYYSGVAAHYICDFLCFAHTSAFEGSVREHLIYEKNQTVCDNDVLLFCKQDSMNYSYSELINSLEERISRYVNLLTKTVNLSIMDIPIAIKTATWATSAAYFHFNVYFKHNRSIERYDHVHRKTA